MTENDDEPHLLSDDSSPFSVNMADFMGSDLTYPLFLTDNDLNNDFNTVLQNEEHNDTAPEDGALSSCQVNYIESTKEAPKHRNGPTKPCLSNWEGDYNFTVELATDMTNAPSKKSWVYSQVLKKIFSVPQKSVPVNFRVKTMEQLRYASIRAFLVYTDPGFQDYQVIRCPNHKEEDCDKDLRNRHHVLQCLDVYAVHNDDNLSVLVPLGNPQPGTDYVQYHYQFKCLSTCVGGISRRALALIFQLEIGDRIVGRRVLKVKICSCPVRDMEREEGHLDGNEEGVSSGAPGKKRKKKTKVAVKHALNLKRIKLEVVNEKCQYNVPCYSAEDFERLAHYGRLMIQEHVTKGEVPEEMLRDFDEQISQQKDKPE